jgi:hypothetical protein
MSASDESLTLWDVKTGNTPVKLIGNSPIAFSLDETLLATGGDVVQLWGIKP